jgi:hypothetical protein
VPKVPCAFSVAYCSRIVVASKESCASSSVPGKSLAAKAAGISPSGLYRYVDGRDGLLELLISDGFETFGSAIEAAGDDSLARIEAEPANADGGEPGPGAGPP